MGEFILPASPSWYCSRVSDCTRDGLFLFGAKNSVYILDISENIPRFRGHFEAHGERVVGVSAAGCPDGERRVATTGDDGRVRLWDYGQVLQHGNVGNASLAADRASVSSRPSAVTLVDQHANHKNKPTSIHWNPRNDDVVISGDDKGTVIVWSVSRSDVKQLVLDANKSAVFCVECSPHNRFHIAVGYKSGLIQIVDISGHGVVLQRLRGHDDEVHCVSWCPIIGEDIRQRSEDDVEEDATFIEGCLLASGSRDRTLRVWSTTRGRCLLIQKVPSLMTRRGSYDDTKVRVWLTLLWMRDKAHTLITSSQTGDLLMWDLCRPGKQKCDVIVPSSSSTRSHQRIVFNLNSPSCTSTGKLVSISMDRQIMVWDLSTRDLIVLPTLGGFPYSMSQSPVNPGRLAIGVGDNMIRIWNTGNPSNPYDSSTLWQGLKSKVTTLCWHPYKEGWLAFGTDDGRVGIYDVLSSKPPKISSTYHKKTVYVVTWGPSCKARGGSDDRDCSFVVYSCGDGIILMHHPGQLDSDALNLRNHLMPQQTHSVMRSEISFKPDFSAVAIGNEDGSIEVYGVPGFHLLVTFHVHRKLINVIRWHPMFSGAGQTSDCVNWLATGSNESTVQVLNVEPYLEESYGSAPMVTDSMMQLEGHTHRITALAWSPHAEGLLVSASYDGTAQVWKLRPCVTPLANFRGHNGRLFSCAWSTDNDDVIYSGGDDFTVLTWYISAQAHTTPPLQTERRGNQKKSKGNKKKKQQQKELEPPSPGSAPPKSPIAILETSPGKESAGLSSADITELQAMLEMKRRQLQEAAASPTAATGESATAGHLTAVQDKMEPSFPASAGFEDAEVDPEEKVPVKREIREPKKRKGKSMFPQFSQAQNRPQAQLHDDCVNIARHIYNGDAVEAEDVIAQAMFMTSRRDMYQLLQHEGVYHKEAGNTDPHLLLHLWSGDLAGVIETAATKGRLNDWMMALAPSVSPHQWRHLCEKYASQLEVEGQVTKAASFLLGVGKTYEAIKLLTRHKQYKEAVSLARLRLSPHDPVIEELYVAWAEQLVIDVCHEQAAKCYLAIDRPLDAARCLSRRSNLSALRAAVKITHLANERTAFLVYGQKFIRECQLRSDWSAVQEVITLDPTFKDQFCVAMTHELLVRQLTDLGLYAGHDLEKATSLLLTESTNANSKSVSKLPKFLLNPTAGDSLCPWPVHLVEEEPAVLYLLRAWLKSNALDLTPKTLNTLYQNLATLREDTQRHASGKQLLLDLALDVTLGVLSLLLTNTNMAAHWWVVAMETCVQTENTALLQGLCRLLLPQGRPSFDLLQQQMVAVQVAALDKGSLSSPLPVSKSRSKFPMPPLEDSDVHNMNNVSSTKNMCTPTDCLGAFYCITVLNAWLTTLDVKQKSKPSQNVASNNVQVREQQSLAAGWTSNVDGDSSSSLEDCQPSEDDVRQLCKALLFDVQAKQNRLMAILKEIERIAQRKQYAVKEATNQDAYSDDKKVDGNLSLQDIPQRLLSCSSLPIIRSISGEYLSMEAREPRKSELPGNDIPQENGHVEPPMAKAKFSIGAGSDDDDDDDTENEDGEHFCDMTGSVKTADEQNSSESLNQRHLKQNTLQNLEHPTGKVNNSYTVVADVCLSDKLSERLVDMRYDCEEVNVTILEEDQALASQQLLEMSAFVTSYPFPDPLRSADQILKFLSSAALGEKHAKLFKEVIEWAKRNAFLSLHVQTLESYQ